MSERRSVTREEMRRAVFADLTTLPYDDAPESLRVPMDRKADTIFDALPATPPASGDVEATGDEYDAAEMAYRNGWRDGQAAIRAESGGEYAQGWDEGFAAGIKDRAESGELDVAARDVLAQYDASDEPCSLSFDALRDALRERSGE